MDTLSNNQIEDIFSTSCTRQKPMPGILAKIRSFLFAKKNPQKCRNELDFIQYLYPEMLEKDQEKRKEKIIK